jgi:transcription-repair coupling factor (superfamily II helicase)
LLAVVTASAADAQRLLDEIPWFAPQLRVRLLPDWETLPYDHFSPHQDLVSERLATLWAAMQGELDILLVPASTAVNRLAPPEFMAAYTFEFRKGQRLDAEKFRSQVTLAGYAHVTQVVSPGEYSIRGGLIDLFPMGSQLPYRLDLFDDEIENIKTFDVDTQRTVYPVLEVRLLPAREFPMDDKGRTHFRQCLPRTLRRRPGQVRHLQGHFDRHRQRRHRVLPAAVLRRNRHALRLPARRCRLRHAWRCAGGHRRLLERHPLALQPAAGRQGTASAAAGGTLPLRRGLLHGGQGLRSTGGRGQKRPTRRHFLPNLAVDRRSEDPLGG